MNNEQKNPKVNSIQDCLDLLGIRENTLSIEEKTGLNENGYIILPNVLNQEQIEQWRSKYEELVITQGMLVTIDHLEEGSRRLSDLVNFSTEYEAAYTHPKVLAAIYHLIGREFKLSSLNARDALPGQGHQWLHVDWTARIIGEPNHVVSCIWMLDDFTSESGASRIVPGSHKLPGLPADHMADVKEPHPNQLLLEAPAGSVAVFSSHCWHGGTQNRTEGPRRGVFGYFTAREFPQELDQREHIRKQVHDQLSDAVKYILDVL